MALKLSEKEKLAIAAAFEKGLDLVVEQCPIGSVRCHAGRVDGVRTALFATGDRRTFDVLYAEALAMRGLAEAAVQLSHALSEKPKGEVIVKSELTAQEVAGRLLRALSDKPTGSKRLAALAGVEYSDTVLDILKRLLAAGRAATVRTEEGTVKWIKWQG